MSDIDNLRDRIDRITFDTLKLLKERNDTAKEIGNLKNNMGLGVTNEQRENQLRSKVLSLCNEIGLDERAGLTALNFLLNESIKVQSTGKQTHLSVFLKAKELERQGRKIIHMEVGEPDFLPPASVRRRYQRCMTWATPSTATRRAWLTLGRRFHNMLREFLVQRPTPRTSWFPQGQGSPSFLQFHPS